MSLSKSILGSDALTARGDEEAMLTLGLPWYRALPWASVAGIRVEVDGAPLGDPVAIDGDAPRRFSRREGYWPIARPIDVTLPGMPSGVTGRDVMVHVTVDLLLPGPLLPDGSPMPYTVDLRRRMVVHASP